MEDNKWYLQEHPGSFKFSLWSTELIHAMSFGCLLAPWVFTHPWYQMSGVSMPLVALGQRRTRWWCSTGGELMLIVNIVPHCRSLWNCTWNCFEWFWNVIRWYMIIWYFILNWSLICPCRLSFCSHFIPCLRQLSALAIPEADSARWRPGGDGCWAGAKNGQPWQTGALKYR